ncbi:unnamed protein product [Microthlaspi erraticum]|uniref:Uncharacterized protein n=1 Tax=Microthlaspi erraticum TaxID=1685480 RepID=A0A6D2KYP4_9BRAS|nr:unnamed protein product [Microthlaspi erraticum]
MSRPGKLRPAVGHATTAHANAVRTGKQSLAAAQPVSRTTADGTVRAGKLRPASGREFIGQVFIRPTTAADHECMTRKSNKDNLVEHPEIDKLEKLLRKQNAQ